MQKKEDRRLFERFKNDVPIVYAHQNTDQFFRAVMRNYSNEGMCFETTEGIDPGSDIYIMMENYSLDAIHAEFYDGYFAEVRWCRPRPDHEPPGYRVGVQYYKTVID